MTYPTVQHEHLPECGLVVHADHLHTNIHCCILSRFKIKLTNESFAVITNNKFPKYTNHMPQEGEELTSALCFYQTSVQTAVIDHHQSLYVS